MELTACRFLKAPQSTQPKKPQRGGPVAQDQTSTQRAKPQGGRRARRPGPVVQATGQSPRGELRSARCTTSTPPHNHKSVTGPGQVSCCGWFFGCRVGGGGRPVTTVKDGSLRTQAVNRKKGGSSRGSTVSKGVSHSRVSDSRPTKEPVAPPKRARGSQVEQTT